MLNNNIKQTFFYLKDSYCVEYNASTHKYEKTLIKSERLIAIDSVERISEYKKFSDNIDSFAITFKSQSGSLYMDKVDKNETVLEFLERIQVPKKKKETSK